MKGSSVCSIEKVIVEDNPVHQPILVDFNDGFDEDSNATSNSDCYLFTDKNKRKRKAIIVKNDNKFFKGSFDNEVCHMFLLVRKKGQSKASLIKVRNCNMYRAVKTQPPKLKASLDTSLQARASNIHNLSQAFGSKRFKRATYQMMRGMKDVAAKEEIIADAIAGVEVGANEIEDAFEAGSDVIKVLLPPCNRSASDVADIYPIENIISTSELESLKGPSEFLSKNPSSGNERDDFLIRSSFKHLGSDPPLIKIQLLLFANALVNFINSPVKELKRRESLEAFCKYSAEVRNKIIREFTSGEGQARSRPVTKRDRAVCYLMIVLLTIFDFKLHIEDLSSCVKGCGQKKLLQLIKVVGAVPMFGKASNKTFILKVPLPKLPEVKPKRKK